MANKDNLIKLVAQKLGPDKLKQMVDQAEQALGNDPDVTPEAIDKIIQMFEYVAEHPEEYQSVIQQAVQTGALDEGDAPPTFDPAFVAIILLSFYGLRDRLGSQQPSPSQMAMPMQDAPMPQMAMGGLHQAGQRLQNAGRGGDTILAHITPQEASLLERRGGTGAINPATGLPEYGFFKKFKQIFKAVAPIALNFIPYVGPYLAVAYGAIQGAKNGGIGGAILGGLGASLGPGGLGSGLTKGIGSFANSAIGNFGGLSNQVLGAGILGAGSAALQGKNPIIGGLTAGALANYAPQIVDKYGNMLPTDVAANMAAGAQAAANTGQNLKGIATSAGVSGLATLANTALGGDPVTSDTTSTPPTVPNPENGMYNSATGKFDLGDATGTGTYGDGQVGNTLDIPANAGGYAPGLAPVVAAPALTANGALSQVAATGTPSTAFNFGDIAKLGVVGALLGGKTPAQATQAIQDSALTAQQKEGMLRGLTNYKFDMGRTTFPSEGTPEWDKMMSDISQGKEQTFAAPTLTEQPALARGGKAKRKPQGALSQVSRLSLGAGDGRSDSIDAKLSDGEYVIDAETVALLGNGSTKAGAAMLDQMRQGIRQQKGKALAKGNFSPNAKSPLAYMKGGLR